MSKNKDNRKSKTKIKLIITNPCLEVLPLPLRELVAEYLQHEERQSMKRMLNIPRIKLPTLTVEEMARDIRFMPENEPHSENVYIPYVPKWILTASLLFKLRPPPRVK